jgi:hypothetical protein
MESKGVGPSPVNVGQPAAAAQPQGAPHHVEAGLAPLPRGPASAAPEGKAPVTGSRPDLVARAAQALDRLEAQVDGAHRDASTQRAVIAELREMLGEGVPPGWGGNMYEVVFHGGPEQHAAARNPAWTQARRALDLVALRGSLHALLHLPEQQQAEVAAAALEAAFRSHPANGIPMDIRVLRQCRAFLNLERIRKIVSADRKSWLQFGPLHMDESPHVAAFEFIAEILKSPDIQPFEDQKEFVRRFDGENAGLGHVVRDLMNTLGRRVEAAIEAMGADGGRR